MKKDIYPGFLFAIAIVSLIVLAAAIPRARNPWTGKWWGIDLYDNSLQSVVFHGGNGLGGYIGFKYVDRGASVCGVDSYGTPLYKADARGTGQITGLNFVGLADIRCLTHPPYIWAEDFTFNWIYDPINNTISDGVNTYSRIKP